MSRDEFVELWDSALSLDEVCDRSGLSRLAASVKASRLRKAGFQMIPFARGRARKYGGGRKHKSTGVSLAKVRV